MDSIVGGLKLTVSLDETANLSDRKFLTSVKLTTVKTIF